MEPDKRHIPAHLLFERPLLDIFHRRISWPRTTVSQIRMPTRCEAVYSAEKDVRQICVQLIKHSMIAGEDNRDYRSFRPSYEYPVERRQVLSVAEDSTRVTHAPAADAEASAAAEHDPAFARPLHFTVQNPNPMTMIRSCRYRLPLAVTFKDQDGMKLSREAALQIATRNRQSKVFSQQQLLMNGQTFYHE